MLARIQQLIVLAIVCVAFAAVAVGVQRSIPWLGPAAIAVAVAGYAGVIATEFWLLHRSYSPGERERPSATELARAWATEILIAPRVFLWQQPFRSASEPDHLPADAHGRRGVVLVHGFFCNRGLWNPWLRRFRAEGIPFVAVNLEPVLGSIDAYGRTIGAAVAAVERTTAQPPIVVAHSMGGLAVRAWLASQPAARIDRLVTIATPHAGTWLARRARSPNAAQMCEGSDWLRALATSEKLGHTQLVCFWSRCDNIVFPTRNATVTEADNRELAGAPHVAMAFHPAVIDEVLRAVRAPAAAA